MAKDKQFSNPIESGMKRSKLRKVRKLGRYVYREGDIVYARTRDEDFKAIIIGFYDNSAIVEDLHSPRRYCVNFRNLISKRTGRPLRQTTEEEALTTIGHWRTAYIPTEEDRRKWKKEREEYDPTYKQ